VGLADAWVTDNKRECERLGVGVATDGVVQVSVSERSVVTVQLKGGG
jgi:uncharacterized protein YigE (DUF2233 family)